MLLYTKGIGDWSGEVCAVTTGAADVINVKLKLSKK